MVLNEKLFSPYTIKMKKNITDENKILENNKMDKNSKSSIIQEYKNKTKKMPKFKDGSYKKDFIKYVRQLVKKNDDIRLFTEPDKVYNYDTGRFVNKKTFFKKNNQLKAKFKKDYDINKSTIGKTIPYKAEEENIDSFKNFSWKGYRAKIKKDYNDKKLFNTIRSVEKDLLGKYVDLRFYNNKSNKSRYITIAPEYLGNYQDFIDRINEIKTQDDRDGSGVIGEEGWSLISDGFRIKTIRLQGRGEGRMLFKSNGIKGGKVSLCGRECLLKCGVKEEDLNYYSIPHINRETECMECRNIGKMGCCNKKSSALYKKGFYKCPECEKFNVYDIEGEYCKPDFLFIDEIIDFINCNELDIEIIGNSFTLNRQSDLYKERKEDIIREKLIINKKNQVRDLIKLTDNEISPVYLHKLEDNIPQHTIIYCENRQHYDLLDNNKKELDDIFLSTRLEVFQKVEDEEKKYVKMFNCKEIYNTNKTKEGYTIYYDFIDYETIINWKSNFGLSEYALSCFRVKDLGLNENNVDIVKKIEKEIENGDNLPKVYVGYDSTKQYIDDLLKFIQQKQAQKEKVMIKFITFNGANFDNFILLDKLLKLSELEEYEEKLNISDIFYNGTQLLNFKINGRHSVFDLCKYLTCSLNKACDSFKIPKQFCKKGFNHAFVQDLYDNDKLDNLLEDKESDFNKKMVEYCAYDTISLSIIYFKMMKALTSISECKKYSSVINMPPTIGSLAYKVLTDHRSKNKIQLPKLIGDNFQYYQDMKKFKVAGRVDTFYGDHIIKEEMSSLDVCSEYPYNMCVNDVWFPHGTDKDILETTDYFKSPTGKSTANDNSKIAFYYCSFNQQILKDKNLPNIYPLKHFQVKKTTGEETSLCLKNDWTYTGEIEDYFLSNVIIDLLIENGVDVNIKNGIVFEKKMKNYELFKPVLNQMMGKNEQDTLKKMKDPSYNPALREMFKLLMNSLSGKVGEGFHNEKTLAIDSDVEWFNLQEKVGETKITCINRIGNKIFTTYKQDDEELQKQQRPVYLSILIYDYSKRLMFNTKKLIGLDKCVYEDTDAIKLRKKDGDELIKNHLSKKIVPHWKYIEQIDARYKTHKLYEPNSKVFGSFENELEHNNYFCKVGKKSYLSIHTEKVDEYYKLKRTGEDVSGHKYKPKMSFKGVNENYIIIENNENLDWVDEDKDGKLKVNNQKSAYEYFNNNDDKKIGYNHIKFFENLVENKFVFVLGMTLQKKVKNSMKCDLYEEDKFIENNTIRNISLIKKISLDECKML